MVGEYDAAIERLQHTLHIANELGSVGLQALTKFHLGMVSYNLGAYRQAIAVLGDNVRSLQGDLARERFGYPSAPALVSRAWLGRSLAEVGDFAEAIRIAEEGLRMAESIESPWTITQACVGIGGVLVTRGDFIEATKPLERGLAEREAKEFYFLSCRRRRFSPTRTRSRGARARAIHWWNGRARWRSARNSGRDKHVCSSCSERSTSWRNAPVRPPASLSEPFRDLASIGSEGRRRKLYVFSARSLRGASPPMSGRPRVTIAKDWRWPAS
jgi:tetratricopeptide (TPR) repeat protein